MKPALLFLSALIGIANASAGVEGHSGPAIRWDDLAPRALKESARSQRPVLVDVWAVWCAPCKVMEETTYRDPEVVEASSGFVPLKVDADAQEAFIRRYRIDAYPTILFLDGDGEEITRLLGLVESDELLAAMREIGSGYASYLRDKDRRKDPEALARAAEYLLEVGNPEGAIPVLKRASKRVDDQDAVLGEAVELRLAEAWLEADDAGAAAKAFERLAGHASEEATRGRALAGLVRAERLRGRRDEADEALRRLRSEFPALAGGLEDAGSEDAAQSPKR